MQNYIRPFFWAFSFIAAFAVSGACFAQEGEGCEIGISGYEQIFMNAGRISRIRILSDHACAARMGLPFLLTNARVEIYEGSILKSTRAMKDAFYSSETERLTGQVGTEWVFMDFKAGEIRSPGHLEVLK